MGALLPDETRGVIELRLQEISQLFHTLDPSPFRESDLALEAEDYIVGCVQELPKTQAIEIVIHLPASEAARHPASDVGRAITHYFRYRARAESNELRELFRNGRIALLIGIAILSACLLLAWQVSLNFGERPISRIVEESSVIFGWVAIWRPAEIFLYGWLPHVRRRALFRRLADAVVTLRSDSPAAAA